MNRNLLNCCKHIHFAALCSISFYCWTHVDMMLAFLIFLNNLVFSYFIYIIIHHKGSCPSTRVADRHSILYQLSSMYIMHKWKELPIYHIFIFKLVAYEC
ncbi:hypothetical protein C0J52_00516 [Blattella germanica]|nr:hypothetical protein C0J52_00516 [Blattella germanica]